MFDYMNESLSSQMRRVSKRTEKNKNKETKKKTLTLLRQNGGLVHYVSCETDKSLRFTQDRTRRVQLSDNSIQAGICPQHSLLHCHNIINNCVGGWCINPSATCAHLADVMFLQGMSTSKHWHGKVEVVHRKVFHLFNPGITRIQGTLRLTAADISHRTLHNAF